jgi:hypothetical protein
MTHVLYIGGCTRSGSTLVDRTLGELPRVVSTGELGLITTHGIGDNRLCGCGERFRDCAFWTAVGERAFGSWDSADASELTRLHGLVDRHRHLVALALPRTSPRFARKLDAYARLLQRLYEAIAVVSGADVVVDSTKAPAYAMILRRVPGLQLDVVQLVRDSRGTAFSAGKRQAMKDSVDRVVMKHQYPPAVITIRWVLYHLLFDLMAAKDGHRMVVRYEDFVARPQESLRRMADHVGVFREAAGEDWVGGGGAEEGWVELGLAHTVAGNDSRFDAGRVALREDREWRQALRPAHRRVVTVLSWPLLRRFGYR